MYVFHSLYQVSHCIHGERESLSMKTFIADNSLCKPRHRSTNISQTLAVESGGSTDYEAPVSANTPIHDGMNSTFVIMLQKSRSFVIMLQKP